MTDTASLITRVTTQGAEEANKQLDDFAMAAASAAGEAAALERAASKMAKESKNTSAALNVAWSVTEKLENQIDILEVSMTDGARAAAILTAQLKSHADATEEDIAYVGNLAGILFDLGEKQKKVADETNRAAAIERQATTDRQKAADMVSQLSNNVNVLQTAQTQGGRAAAILNAQIKLGSSATDEQRQRVAQLTGQLYDMSNATQTATSSQSNLTKSSGQSRQQVQQLGYQLQDFVVQVQGGTSAFVAFGQQGSQLAGAFGPGGAILGAVIALGSAFGGVLYKSLTDAKISTKDLEDANAALAFAFSKNTQGVYELSDGMIQLSKTSSDAAKNLLSLTTVQAKVKSDAAVKSIRDSGTAMFDYGLSSKLTTQQLDDMLSKNVDVVKTLRDAKNGANTAATGYGNLIAAVGQIADKYGTSADEATKLLVAQRAFNREPTAANAQKAADASLSFAQASSKNTAEVYKNTEALQKNAIAISEADQLTKAASDAQKNLGKNTNETTRQQKAQNEAYVNSIEVQSKRGKEKIKAQYDQEVAAIKSRDKLTDAQRDRALKAAKDGYDANLKDFETREQKKSDVQDRRNAAAQKKDENALAVQKKNAQTFLDSIDRGGVDQIAKIDAIEKQKIAVADKYLKDGIYNQATYDKAITDIRLNAQDARDKELEKRRQAQIEKDSKHDDFINQTQALNATELDLLDIQERAKEEMAQKYRDKGYINEQEYQEGLAQIQQSYNKKRIIEYSNMLGTTTDNLKAALGEGNKAYKAFAIANAIMNTYQGAVAAFQSAAAIPIVGWVAAPIAAAAAVAAGLANVAKIRAAREQGGNLSPGQISTIAERGKPEVIMPAGASRVRTAQQMRQIMGENSGSGSRNDSVVIVNNTTGRIDSATTERDDEGRLRVIISETVSAAFGDSNSDISKARRGTRGLPGY